MALVATIPPMAIFKSVSPAEQTLSRPLGSSPAWRDAAISHIAALVKDGRAVPGFGDFRPTPQAVGMLRLELNAIALESLPKPALCHISGGGLMARWSSGDRSVEITVYHDGEVVRDAVEGTTTNETISELTATSMLLWMSNRSVLVNASLR